eukprot:COSAG01_NODE_34869_length_540_cov_6.290249_2_plen_104_part_01
MDRKEAAAAKAEAQKKAAAAKAEADKNAAAVKAEADKKAAKALQTMKAQKQQRSETCLFGDLARLTKIQKNSRMKPFHFWGIPIYIYITKVKSLFSGVFFVSYV